jgi:hypothetical protein
MKTSKCTGPVRHSLPPSAPCRSRSPRGGSGGAGCPCLVPLSLPLLRPGEMVAGPAVSCLHVASVGRSSAAPCQIAGDFRLAAVAALPRPSGNFPRTGPPLTAPQAAGLIRLGPWGWPEFTAVAEVNNPCQMVRPAAITGLRVRTGEITADLP